MLGMTFDGYIDISDIFWHHSSQEYSRKATQTWPHGMLHPRNTIISLNSTVFPLKLKAIELNCSVNLI